MRVLGSGCRPSKGEVARVWHRGQAVSDRGWSSVSDRIRD